eukprot:scaffold293764_cov30-Tisochrysis_lutea.AAC.4
MLGAPVPAIALAPPSPMSSTQACNGGKRVSSPGPLIDECVPGGPPPAPRRPLPSFFCLMMNRVPQAQQHWRAVGLSAPHASHFFRGGVFGAARCTRSLLPASRPQRSRRSATERALLWPEISPAPAAPKAARALLETPFPLAASKRAAAAVAADPG